MKKLKVPSIKTRLTIWAAVSALLIAMIGSLGLYQMNATNNALTTIYNDRVIPLKQLKIVADMYAVNIIDTHNKLDAGRIDTNTAITNIEEAQKVIQEQWKAYTNTYLVDAEKETVTKLGPMMRDADSATQTMIDIIRTGDKKAITALTASNYAVVDPISDEINKLVNIQLNVAKQEFDGAIANFNRLKNIVILFTVLAIAAGLIYALIFARNLEKLLGGEPAAAREIANTIANGDLSADIEVKTGCYAKNAAQFAWLSVAHQTICRRN
jgi:methyl-accepting chemotaxis protein